MSGFRIRSLSLTKTQSYQNPHQHQCTANNRQWWDSQKQHGGGKDESSKTSDYQLSHYYLPVQQTFKLEDDATPYRPHAQGSSRTGLTKPQHLHSSKMPDVSYGHHTQYHNTKQIGSSYRPPQSLIGAAPRTDEPSSSSTIDLAELLICREMISSGLLRFDDLKIILWPENHWAWKESLHSSTEDLNLTSEERRLI